MNKQQLYNNYKSIQYKGTLSYSDGLGFLETNDIWVGCLIKFKGDATIIPNTRDIIMGCRYHSNSILLNLLIPANPKHYLFRYFGELIITDAILFGMAFNHCSLAIESPNKDFPNLMHTNPEDSARFPEDIKDGNVYHNKGSLRMTQIINSKKRGRNKSAKRGGRGGKTSSKQSRTTSGGSTY